MLKITTEVIVKERPQLWGPGAALLSAGSCFVNHVSQDLGQHGFRVLPVPFGILYNAVSISQALQRLASGSTYRADELQVQGERHFSWDHHGQYASNDMASCLRGINQDLKCVHRVLPQLEGVLITVGTAYVYRLKSTGRVVANCHKMEPSLFSRERLSQEEQVGALLRAIDALRQHNKALPVILTLSPIRHLRDDASENSLSKASVRMALQSVCEQREQLSYFPAFEILMDELRDYRFYQKDLVHPSELAVQIIMGRFCEAYLTPEALKLRSALLKWMKGAHHRHSPGSEHAQEKHHSRLLAQLKSLKGRFPEAFLGEAEHLLHAMAQRHKPQY